jgi:arsenate reductase
VITLCDDAARDCPALPARRGRIQWSLPDPGRAGGDEAQLAIIFRQVREEIERRLRQWLGEEGLLAEKS